MKSIFVWSTTCHKYVVYNTLRHYTKNRVPLSDIKSCYFAHSADPQHKEELTSRDPKRYAIHQFNVRPLEQHSAML